MVLSDEARELRNKRMREYYRTHKRQYKEANRRYWERQAQLEKEKTQAGAESRGAAKPDD